MSVQILPPLSSEDPHKRIFIFSGAPEVGRTTHPATLTARLKSRSGLGDELPNVAWIEGQFVDLDAKRCECVDDRVREDGRRRKDANLAGSLHASGDVRRGRLAELELD